MIPLCVHVVSACEPYAHPMSDDGVDPRWNASCPSCAEPMRAVPLAGSTDVVLKCFECGLTTL